MASYAMVISLPDHQLVRSTAFVQIGRFPTASLPDSTRLLLPSPVTDFCVTVTKQREKESEKERDTQCDLTLVNPHYVVPVSHKCKSHFWRIASIWKIYLQ